MEEKRVLWADLISTQSLISHDDTSPPWCVMGDLNVILSEEETNVGLPSRIISMTDFHECIVDLVLTDLRCEGLILTRWDCNIEKPSMHKLDRVLTNEKWLEVFDMSLTQFLPHGLSDHYPAVVKLGINMEKIRKPFQVFHYLLEYDEFLYVVEASWSIVVNGDPWYVVLNKRLNIIKQDLKGLNIQCGNTHSKVIEARETLIHFQDNLPLIPNVDQRLEERRCCNDLAQALADEELFLKQKSQICWLKNGDGNNKYFFNVCKDRWNVNKIFRIEDDLGQVHTSHYNISNVAAKFYQNLLSTEKHVADFPTDLSFPSLTSSQISNLDEKFTAPEILKCFKGLAINKSSGPDGFTAELFLKCWHIIGADVTRAAPHFFDTLEMPRIINAATLALVSKQICASLMSHFRPISCCNTLYKCISKLLAARMKVIMPSLISSCQTTFIPGRRISDNVMLAQAICKDYHLHSGPSRVAFKIDIHKAFDTLN